MQMRASSLSNFRVENYISAPTLLCYLTDEYIMTLEQKDVNRLLAELCHCCSTFVSNNFYF